MPHLREEADADRVEHRIGMTDSKTELNPYEMFCSACGRTMYVDAESKDHFTRAMEHNPDNQFFCDECASVDDEMSHAAH